MEDDLRQHQVGQRATEAVEYFEALSTGTPCPLVARYLLQMLLLVVAEVARTLFVVVAEVVQMLLVVAVGAAQTLFVAAGFAVVVGTSHSWVSVVH